MEGIIYGSDHVLQLLLIPWLLECLNLLLESVEGILHLLLIPRLGSHQNLRNLVVE